MFFADYHVHSDISQDSAATMYEMVEAEAKMGMEQICFTNHCDMCHWRTYEFDPRCLGKVPETMEKYAAMLSEHPALPLDVRLGLELGEPLFEPELARRIAGSDGLDMIIGSLHILQDYGDLWAVKFRSDRLIGRVISDGVMLRRGAKHARNQRKLRIRDHSKNALHTLRVEA